ncbi:MAG: NUDIX hydrolase [Gemmatimonadota bacterium]
MSESPRLATARVYSGRVLNLDVDRVRFPDGSEGELEMVRHSGASAVVPFVSDPAGDDPRLLLIRQYRYAAESYLFEIPAGRLDPGESPLDCAVRELREETGCTAERVEPLTSFYTTPGFTDERIHLFMASGLSMGESRRERDEFIEVVTHPLSEVLAMIERGEIVDGKTLVGILFAAGYRLGR